MHMAFIISALILAILDRIMAFDKPLFGGRPSDPPKDDG